MRYNTGDYIQRGAGLGSLFGSLFKAVMPAAKALGNLGVRALKSDVLKKTSKNC